MRGRVQTRKIIEVRVRSELRSVFAVDGKSSCFCSRTQSEIEPANLQNKGLRGAPALLAVKLNPPSFSSDLLASLAPVVVFKTRSRWKALNKCWFVLWFSEGRRGEMCAALGFHLAPLHVLLISVKMRPRTAAASRPMGVKRHEVNRQLSVFTSFKC